MTKVDRSMDLRFIAVLTAWVIFAVGCAATSLQDSQPGEATEPPPMADGQVDEIIVTGYRVGDAPVAVSEVSGKQITASGIRNLFNLQGYYSARAREYATAEPLSFDEELWVISVPAGDPQPNTDDESPGSGAMVARFPDEIDEDTGVVKEVPLPLQHTSVTARINGYISAVNVRQQFSNPFDEKIEAVYLFPLPEKAAVSEFLMIIGERKIRGILREKEEAEAIYHEARRQGYQAACSFNTDRMFLNKKSRTSSPESQST